MSALAESDKRVKAALANEQRKAKADAAFMRRTLARIYERGLNARDLFLREIAQEAVDAEFSDVFMRWTQPQDRQTRKGAVESFQELLGERDFGYGLAQDLWATCVTWGFPRVSKQERHRLQQLWCFVGKASQPWDYEGV